MNLRKHKREEKNSNFGVAILKEMLYNDITLALVTQKRNDDP